MTNVMRIRRIWLGLVLAGLVLGGLQPRAAEAGNGDDALTEAGDWLQMILPLSAFGATWIADDKEGRIQFLKQFGASIITVRGLKLVADKYRPDASNPESFPSGHATGAFTGAWFLQFRYGEAVGYPAIALAALVGYSRINAQAHFADDVLAGAGLTALSAAYFVSPFKDRTTFAPVLSNGKFGLEMRFTPSDWRKKTDPPPDFERRWRFSFEFGSVWQTSNDVQAPTDTGTVWSLLDGWDQTMNPSVTSQASIEALLGEGHEVAFTFNPFETRDFGASSTPILFGGTTFPANTPLRNAYRVNDFRIRYRYDVLNRSEDWNLYVGATAALFALSVGMEADTGESAKVDDNIVLPLAHFAVHWRFVKDFRLLAEMEGIYLSSDSSADTLLAVNWRFHPRWDLTLGWRWQDRDIDTSGLRNKWRQDRAVLGLAYSW